MEKNKKYDLGTEQNKRRKKKKEAKHETVLIYTQVTK